MKVIITVCEDLGRDNGTTVRARRVRKALGGQGSIVLAGRADRSVDGIIAVERPGSRLWNLRLAKVLWEEQPDRVYCASDFFGFLTAYPLTRLNGARLIFEAHGILSKEYWAGRPHSLKVRAITMFYRMLERFVASRADCFVALSEDIARFYAPFREELSTIPVFVDDELFSTAASPTPHDGLVVGIIGPFHRENINNTFLDFVHDSIPRLDPRIRFKVIGLCDDELRFEHPRVEFTGYLDSQAGYVSALASIDAVVVPSRAPSFGALNKILEPMSMGKPVLTTPVGLVGIDGAGDENIIVADEALLPARLNELLLDRQRFEAIGHGGRKLVMERYAASVNRLRLNSLVEGT
mgnify:CR=1 FL=1